MDDLTEEELRQIVSGTSNDWMDALKKQHPDWIMQAIQSQPASSETGEMAGPIEGYTFYDPKKTKAGEDKFKRYDVSGKLLGEQQFKKPGNAWDMTKQFVADVGPLLQFVPTLAPFVRAISALSAAEQGNVLGALASGLPLADKIPGLDKATAAALQSAGKYAAVASAAKSKDPMQLLNALSQTPEFGGKVPPELKTIGEYASKAGALQRASKGDINALLGLAKGVTAPGKSYFPGYDEFSTGEEGFFAPGGPGYVAPEAGDSDSYIQSLINSEEALPKDITEFLPASEVIRERISLEDRFPPPDDTLNLEDFLPGTGLSTQTDQTIDITGRKETADQDLGFTPFTPGRSIRDVGPVTQIKPGEKLEGTDVKEPDLSLNLPTVPGGVKAKTPSKEDQYKQLMAALLAMQGKRPEQEKYELFSARPLGYELFYGMEG